ncbi:MAG TPA: TonB-dependent receptor [Steroidobacteraceae bacterium]|nr:TonB-dependent receptor [Steroidobacteraceae bacterium]
MPVALAKRPQSSLARTPVASAVLLALASPSLLAQDTTALGEVIVTAQKRAENLQDVPISLESLNNESLEQLNVQNFKDYVKMLPTVTQAAGAGGGIGGGSGFNLVYMRGVATGGDGQATTSQPSVGTYLDEQPITTVQGNLDVHLYDIARVEALAGPQGTLYGASSQAGTIRIITNQPDPGGFEAGYSLEGNLVDGDDSGYVLEGFVNIPVSENAAIRLVGWTLQEGGWIDNVAATRLYPGDAANPDDDFLADNAEFVEDNYNTTQTTGARAALRVDLGENWSITPSAMYQTMDQDGAWADDLSDFVAPGDHKVAHFRDEFTDDEWWQAGLTIEGTIGNFDVVYSGNYLTRDVETSFDYSDYSYWYDTLYSTGSYAGFFAGLFVDNDGNFLNRAHSFEGDDSYNKTSHEIRITTPQDNRVRGLLGLFYQKQYHDFFQTFGNVEGLADQFLMNNAEQPGAQQFPGIVYLNSVERTDIDQAVFGQIQFDITDRLELSLGARYFEPETTVKGFFGFGLGYNPGRAPGTDASDVGEPGDPANGGAGSFSPDGQGWSRNGEWRCPSQEDREDAPCQNVDKLVEESDYVGRVNLSFKATDTAMLYATWSEGYRPGGINRDPFNPDFESDFLTNWELGWKTRFMDDRLQFNGAVFLEQWEDIQVAFPAANGITAVVNGPEAEIQGVEAQIDMLPTDRLRLGVAFAYYDSELKDVYCEDCDGPGDDWAPAGTPLPITADFKGNLIARYTFPLGAFEAHAQGALAYEGERSSSLNVDDAAILGDIPAATYLDLAFGVENDKYAIELFVSNATDEDSPLYISSECATGVCGDQAYGTSPRPRTYGIRFKQDF